MFWGKKAAAAPDECKRERRSSRSELGQGKIKREQYKSGRRQTFVNEFAHLNTGPLSAVYMWITSLSLQLLPLNRLRLLSPRAVYVQYPTSMRVWMYVIYLLPLCELTIWTKWQWISNNDFLRLTHTEHIVHYTNVCVPAFANSRIKPILFFLHLLALYHTFGRSCASASLLKQPSIEL